MKEKRIKITEFINSMEGNELGRATCLMGGATGGTASPMTATNNADCKNGSFVSCDKATNHGNCRNVLNYCNNSKNGGSCDNAYITVLEPVNPNPDKNVTISCGQ